MRPEEGREDNVGFGDGVVVAADEMSLVSFSLSKLLSSTDMALVGWLLIILLIIVLCGDTDTGVELSDTEEVAGDASGA